MASNDIVLLTSSQVDALKKESASIRLQITKLQEKLTYVAKKLEAASYFLNESSHTKQENLLLSFSPSNNISGRIVISDAVLNLIRNSKTPLSKSDIKYKLKEMGIEKVGSSPSYLHTLMRRLIEKNQISKKGEYYSRAS